MASPHKGDRHVTFGLRAPAPRFPRVDIFRIRPGSWYDLIILTSKLYGCEVYYEKPRTQPVNDSQRADPRVYDSLLGKRWQGWLAVRTYHNATVYLVAVTKVTVACVPQLEDPDQDLRGWTIGLTRDGDPHYGKVRGRWNNARANLDKLGHPPDVPDCLARMWNAPTSPQSIPSSAVDPPIAGSIRTLLAEVADSLVIPS